MWEYKVVYLEGDNTCYEEYDEEGRKILITLNTLGEQGWEMTGTLIIQSVPVGYFKRPKLDKDHEMGPENKVPYQDLR